MTCAYHIPVQDAEEDPMDSVHPMKSRLSVCLVETMDHLSAVWTLGPAYPTVPTVPDTSPPTVVICGMNA